MRILLISAYDAASHRQWRRGLIDALPEFEWLSWVLPARHFAWRVRGNPLAWIEETVGDRPPDLILATSMTDLATLKGLRRELARVPSLLYCHENQFAYPSAATQRDSVEPQITSLYAALAADRVLFNSDHNRDTFLGGARRLLAAMPDHADPGIVDRIADRSDVVPVGLDAEAFRPPRPLRRPVRLLWNHRWEYDKGPDRLALALDAMDELGIDWRIDIVGQQFRRRPSEFDRIRADHGSRIDGFGFVPDRSHYLRLLADADVVVSTALHDFQGLSVLEAVASGCRPLVPDRLAYAQWIPEEYRYLSVLDDPAAEAHALAVRLGEIIVADQGEVPDLSDLAWEQLADRYRSVILTVASKAQR